MQDTGHDFARGLVFASRLQPLPRRPLRGSLLGRCYADHLAGVTPRLKKIRTQIFKISSSRPSKKVVDEIARIVRDGGVFIFPTDTVYGIGCHAFLRESVRRVYALKGRHYSKPLPVLIHDPHEVWILAESIPKEAHVLMRKFWPGPLTLVFKASLVARIATAGRDTVAIRLPKDKFSQSLMQTCGVPLASTSANLSGRPALCSGREAIRHFNGRVEAIIDTGETKHQVPSTVLDLSSFPFTVRREGAVPKQKLFENLTKPSPRPSP